MVFNYFMVSATNILAKPGSSETANNEDSIGGIYLYILKTAYSERVCSWAYK